MSPSIDYAVTLGLAFCLAIKYVFWDDDNIEKDIEIIEEHPVTKSEDAITPIKRKLMMSTAMQNIQNCFLKSVCYSIYVIYYSVITTGYNFF